MLCSSLLAPSPSHLTVSADLSVFRSQNNPYGERDGEHHLEDGSTPKAHPRSRAQVLRFATVSPQKARMSMAGKTAEMHTPCAHRLFIELVSKPALGRYSGKDSPHVSTEKAAHGVSEIEKSSEEYRHSFGRMKTAIYSR